MASMRPSGTPPEPPASIETWAVRIAIGGMVASMAGFVIYDLVADGEPDPTEEASKDSSDGKPSTTANADWDRRALEQNGRPMGPSRVRRAGAADPAGAIGESADEPAVSDEEEEEEERSAPPRRLSGRNSFHIAPPTYERDPAREVVIPPPIPEPPIPEPPRPEPPPVEQPEPDPEPRGQPREPSEEESHEPEEPVR